VFSTELTPDDYTRDNLEEFVREARELAPEYGEEAVDMYNDFAEQLANQEATLKHAIGENGKPLTTTEKSARNKELIYDFLKQWEGVFGKLPELGEEKQTVSRKNLITTKQIESIFNNGLGATELIQFIKDHAASQFNANALQLAASLLGVSGVSAATKGVLKDRKREIIRDMILNSNGLENYAKLLAENTRAKESMYTRDKLADMETDQLRQILRDMKLSDQGTRAELINRILENQKTPVITTTLTKEALSRMTNDELKAMLASVGLPYSNLKKEGLVERILANASRFGNNASREKSVYDKLSDIIAKATRGNIAEAKQDLRNLGANAIASVNRDELLRVARVLSYDIPTNATKDVIIQELTGTIPTSSVQKATKNKYKSSYSSCIEADHDEVVSLAKSMGIRYVGVSKETLCKNINEHFLHNAIDKFLVDTNAYITSLEKAISHRTPKQRETAISGIARRAGFTAKTLHQLLTQFFESHYRIRALNINPRLVDNVEKFIHQGVISGNLGEFARIFSDIDPDLLSLEDRAIADQLQLLYNNVFGPIAADDRTALSIIEKYIDKLNYEVKHSSNVIMAREELREPGHRPVVESMVEPVEEIPDRHEEEILPGVDVEHDSEGTRVVVDARDALRDLEEDQV